MNESEKQLNAIKETLFFKCALYADNYRETKKHHSKSSAIVEIRRAFVNATYSIIEECGLVDEYEAWKRERGV